MPISATAFSFNLTAVSGNNPPNPPSIAGPTAGNTGTGYIFDFNAIDPDGDQLRYWIDWDNNSLADAIVPSAGWTNSGWTQQGWYLWWTPGTYTFQAITQDVKGAFSAWTQHTITINAGPVAGVCGAANGIPTATPPTFLCNAGTPGAVAGPDPYTWTCFGQNGGANAACSAPYLSPAPAFDLKINGSDGPLSVAIGTNLNITWGPVANATSCTGSGNGWNGGKSLAGGSDNVPATAASLYTLSCTGPGGTTTDSVSVSLSNTLKMCESSCNSGINPGSFSMAQGATKNVVACWNPAASCTDPSGNVTGGGSDTWTEGGGGTVSLSGGNPKTISANASGNETISVTYSGNTVTKNVNVTCVPQSCDATEALKYCSSETFTWTTGCAAPAATTQTCSGSKSCDFNWKEVAPR